jgi:anti-sigma factor RsiW
MMNNRCRWVRHRLALLAGDPDGRDLAWDDRRAVERHLVGCDSCRSERTALESTVGLLHAVSSALPCDPEAPSIWPALSRQIQGTRHPRPSPWFGLGAGPILGMAAGTLIVGGAIGLTGWHLGSASAARGRPQVKVEAFQPRPALPSEVSPRGQLVGDGLPAKADPRSEVDSKATGPGANPRDPQRSQ